MTSHRRCWGSRFRDVGVGPSAVLGSWWVRAGFGFRKEAGRSVFRLFDPGYLARMPRKSLLHWGIASFSLFNVQLTRRFVVASPSSETVSGKNDSFCFPTNSERFSFIASSVASAPAWTRPAASPNNNLPREHTGDVVDDVILPRASIYASTRTCDRKPLILFIHTVFEMEKVEYITWNTLNFDICQMKKYRSVAPVLPNQETRRLVYYLCRG